MKEKTKTSENIPRKRKPFFLLIMLLPASIALALVMAPRILSYPIAREFTLNQINRKIDGELSVRSWSLSWNAGCKFNEINFVRATPEINFKADGLTVNISILELAKTLYYARKLEKGDMIETSLTGDINLYRGKLTVQAESDPTIAITDLNAVIKLESPYSPVFMTITARNGIGEGSATITGSVQVLSDGLFEPEKTSGSAWIKIENWDLTPFAKSAFKPDSDPSETSATLGGALSINLHDLETFDARGEFALWYSLNQASKTSHETMDLQIDIFKKGAEIECRKLALDTDFATAELTGKFNLSESNALPKANITLEANGNLKDIVSKILLYIPEHPISVLRESDAKIGIKGQMTFNPKENDNKQNTFSLKLKADAEKVSNITLPELTPTPININEFKLTLNADGDINATEGVLNIADTLITAKTDFAEATIEGDRISMGMKTPLSIKRLDLSLESDFSRIMPTAQIFFTPPEGTIIQGDIKVKANAALEENVIKIPSFIINLSSFTFLERGGLTLEQSARASGSAIIPLAPSKAPMKGLETECVLFLQSGRYKGIRVSEMSAPVRIKNGLMELDIETKVNEGKLFLPLRVDMNAEHPAMEIPDQTTILQGVRLTNEMINELLTFITPILKDCAVATGTIDLRLNRFKIPLSGNGIEQHDFSSVCSFNDITLSPAGLLFDILSLIRLQQAKVIVPNQNVESHLRNGRIHSSAMTIKTGEADMVFGGSVGIDQTINFNIKIPITSNLVGKNAYEYLRGESISLPITGTIQNPVFDKTGFIEEITRASTRVGTEILKKKILNEAEILKKKPPENLDILKKRILDEAEIFKKTRPEEAELLKKKMIEEGEKRLKQLLGK